MTNNNTFLTEDARNALRSQAIHAYDGMVIVYPWTKTEKAFMARNLVSKFNDCFSMMNETVCFVIDENVYVTPYSKEVFYLLGLARLKEAVFEVPLCNGEYPKHGKREWEKLCEESAVKAKDEFEKDCIKYSNKKGILKLDDKILKNCFKMPDTGVLVKHRMYKITYYPYIISSEFNRWAMGYIGQFWENSGKVVFIYIDGTTYVGKGYGLVNILKEANYMERSIFVPFSNGENILDPVQKDMWMSLKKF